MEEGYELDLTYITERIIAVSFPRGCSEEIYAHNLKDVTRMLKSKHADNYLIINLSERRSDLSRMNPRTLDTGWPDQHAPPLDKICTICKAMESWLNADPLHVVVIHCRGGKGRIGVVISSFVHFTDVSASADQALDRFAMRKYYDDKVSALMTPSQKRYVWILNSLLSGSMKINASPLFLHCIILHGIPNFDSAGVCRPYIKVYQGMQAVYSSAIYHIGQNHRDRVCVPLEPAQLLKGDIMIKCYHKSDLRPEREVIFRLQFHTGAVQGYSLMFEKEDMENADKDPRFPDYGKVELVFSEGPERIPGADRWNNGADVIVDYNTTDPLTRWDSYQNMCDTEAPPRAPALNQDKATNKRRDPAGGEPSLGRGVRTTSATSSPDHSDHALSVSSDSGLSSTSLWADKPTTISSGTIRPNQGPSQLEKVQLKRLLSGFGLEDPSLDEMDGPGSVVQKVVPAQVHINGDPRPRERETDILDDEVITGHDLHSVDSLGTLSSSCHKSSQNSLLSDGFGSPGAEDHLSQTQNHIPTIEEYDRGYNDIRRPCTASRSNSVASPNPSNAMAKQHVYRQGTYSTQSWVRQQQMVAAQKIAYMPDDGNERFSSKQGSVNEPPTRDVTDTAGKETAMVNNNNNNKRDEEFKTLTMDIDNSIDQLNQLIMDLDPTFVLVKSQNSTLKRSESSHVNGSAKFTNGTRFGESNESTLKSTQQTAVQSSESRLVSRSLSRQENDVTDHPGFCSSGWAAAEDYRGQSRTYSPCLPQSQSLLYRSDSTDYRSQGPDTDSGVEAGSDMTPPTPAFPISPPTPYVKNMSEFNQRQTPSFNIRSFSYKSEHDPRGFSEVESLAEPSVSCHRTLTHSTSVVGTLQRTDSSSISPPWPEHPALTRHASLNSYPPPRDTPASLNSYPPPRDTPASLNSYPPPRDASTSLNSYPPPRDASASLNSYPSPRDAPLPHHPVALDYNHHSTPLHQHPHIHPAPNGHSSPRSSQRTRMAHLALNRCPAQGFEEQEDPRGSYGTDSPLLTSVGRERSLLTVMEGHHQPPLLPEKKRASDGEHSLGTASPVPSGFSSPHSGSSLSIPFPNVLPDLSTQMSGTPTPLPDVLASKQLTVKFVQDTSKFWYKADISRDQAISVLKDKEPGSFIVRDSHSFKGAYGLAMKVATPPPSVLQQGNKKGGDLANELVRHFLIECTQKGVRLKGCPNEPYFGSLTALVCQHSITPLALPCKLIIPDRDPLEDIVENASSVSNSAAELLKQGAACNVWYLGSAEMESLTGTQAVQKATTMTLHANPPVTSTVVHFKVSSQGITLTDNQRKLFFRRHYNVNTVIFCALDPQDRKWKVDGYPSAKIFGFVARKSGTSMDNICHLFAEHDPEQPASAIVNFVSRVMIGSHKSK